MNDQTIEEILPLTPMQKGMLVLAYEASSSLIGDPYVTQTWGFLGNVDNEETTGTRLANALRHALQMVTDRHQALRSAFITEGQSEPRQVILGNVKASVKCHDWRTEATPEKRFIAALKADREKGFDLDRAPLIRLQLFQTANQWRFLLTHHHIILDGWALSIIFDELQHFLKHLEADTLPPGVKLGDIQKRFQKPSTKDLAPFWHSMLDGWTANPIQSAGPTLHQSGHTRTSRTIPAEIVSSFARATQTWHLTQGELATAAWILCLNLFCNDDWITTGLTTSGRDDRQDAEAVVGMFANTLPIRVACRSGLLLNKFIARVADLMREVIERDDADLNDLQRLSGATMADPLFDTLIAFENIPGSTSENLAIRFDDIQTEERTNLAAALVVVPGTQWKVAVQSRNDRLAPHLAAQICDDYVVMLRLLCEASSTTTIGALLDSHAAEANRTSSLPAPRSIHRNLIDTWLDVVSTHTTCAAARFNGREIQYSELHQQATSIAASLQRQGLVAGDRVAVKLSRGIDLLAVMAGVVLAGGCYVPIDTLQPDARAEAIVSHSQAAFIITETLETCLIQGVQSLTVDKLKSGNPAAYVPVLALPPSAAAYMIFTSGSTGRPKGVTVSHGNLLALLAACKEPVGHQPGDVWSFFHAFSFDFSVWEIWGALLSGGTVLVVSYEDSRDPQKFIELCRHEGVTILSQTPSAFRNFVQAEAMTKALPELKSVVFGGEALATQDLIRWCERHPLEETNLVNMYGITETTVHVTAARLSQKDILSGPLAPLGGPLAHLSLALLDQDGRAVPTYSTGEIVVGGSGLAWGYEGLPRLTAERFQPDPDALRPGTRRYLSGDLACLAADGSLLPIGRKDQQLKLRGFRIEAGEVEAALMKIATITGAIVGVFQRGADSDAGIGLCAHLVVQSDHPLDQTNVFEQLKERLPDYMIPERMKVIDEFPLTANGKIARDKLPNPFDDSDGASRELIGAKDPLVRKICDAWSTALALPSVAPSDNYFSLGGDSIRSLKVLSEAEKIGLSISIADLFRYPTPAGLAEAMAGGETKPSKPSTIQEDTPFYLLNTDERAKLPTDAVDAWPASRLQVGMIFHANMADEPTVKGQYIDVFTYKITQQGTAANLLHAVENLVEKYPVLRSCFATATDRLLQIVVKSEAPKLELHDFRGLNGATRRKEIDRLHHQLSDDVPDIGAENLFRVVACQHDEEQWTLMFRFHHAILDGWSFALLTSELFARWTDAQQQPSDAAEVLPVSQNAQARFVEREISASNNDALRRRWQKRLATLPTDSLWPWPAESDLADAGRVKIELPTHTAHELSKLAENTELPLKSWLMACAGRVIAWAVGVDASVLGLITSCRPESEDTGDAIGMFLNTLPVVLDGGETWMHAAQQALAAEADVIDDRMLPLSELVRMAERRPFMASFNFVHFRPTETATVHTVTDAERSRETTDIDLAITFSLSPDGGRLHGEISYGAKIPVVQASHIAAALSETIGAVIQQSNGPAFVPRDRPQLLTAPAHDWLSPVHCRVIDSLAKSPETLRVIESEGKSYSGKVVLERVAAAKMFFEAAQLRPGQGVVLNLPRGMDFLACLLAVGLLGGWTVTLDPDAPPSRAESVIADIPDAIIVSRDANCSTRNRFSLAPDDLEKHFNQSPKALAAEILTDVRSHPSLPAYAIYTSGSTGQPKGVIIDHANLANHMDWMIEAFEFSETDRFLFRTKPSFDASIWEIWAPLLTGAPLIIADEMIALDCTMLAELVEKQKITRLQLVPSLLDLFLMDIERTQLRMLRTLFVGGEAFPNDLAEQAAELGKFDVVNLYGPTETTIHAATHYFTSQNAFKGLSSVPIGKPVDGVYLSVESSSGRQMPIGALGSLFIGGASVGQGYANLPRLTAEQYVPDPAHPGQRRFDSRDQVRILSDSSLLFVGRVDDQVKLAGNRIELGDIEAALRIILPNCRNAVLLENTSVMPRLVAYVEDLPDIHVKIDDEAIRAGLAERLPGYMIPSHYRIVRDWPILSSGKTDRRHLPNQATDRNQHAKQTTADIEGPHSEVIGTLLTMACDQLGMTVTANDDFFTQGADSIMVMQLVSRARSQGLVFTPRDVFTARTMLNLAPLVKKADYRQKATQQGTKGLSPAQEWFFTRDLENPDWWNQVVALEILASIERQDFIQACEKIAKRHPAFAQRFTSDGLQDGGAPQPLVSTIQVTAGQQDASGEWWLEIERVQAEEINFATGPLWAVVLECDDGDRVSNAALIIHHLIIDGLSWRILFDELRDGLAGKIRSEDILQSWLWLDPEREDVRNLQLPYWRQQAEIIANHNLPTVLSPESQSIIHRLVVPRDCTRSLIKGDTQSPENMEASLCAAVLSALHASNKKGNQCLAVERHGRDRLPENAVDTIGWFTALWPMVLETSNDSSALRLDVCQQLLLLRDFDVDWFAACQLDANLTTVIEPFIVVNFLGSFSASFTDVSFRPLAEMKTSVRAPLNQRTSVLEISALIEDDQLIISISADRQFLKPWEILGFADAMEQSLASLSKAAPPISADHPLVALDWPGQKLSSLMELSTRGNGTDIILPLTPVQEGILFQQHRNRISDGIYNQQVSLVVDGMMDEHNLARAFERLVERHEALRTCFAEDADGYQVQLVKEKAILPIKWIDLPEDEADAKLEWAAVISDDECIPFDERRAPLSRLTVGRQGKRWHLLWSHHHAILDGWSLPILLNELELPEQEWAQLPPPVTRAPFWKWLATQRHPGRQRARSDAWRQRFAGMDHATLVGAQLGQGNDSTKNNRHKSHVNKDVCHRLRNFAQQSGVTVAAIVQAAFGMVLASLTYQRDLAIGVVQSGRPPEVIGANDWVGMFMNTLPLRITVTPSQPLNEWLAEIQDQILENQTAVADGLADIQAWVGLGALFDAIVIFQNYPLRGTADYMQNGARIVDFSLAERNEFALSLYVTESEGLDFELCAGTGGPSNDLLEATARSLHHVLSQWLQDPMQPLCATSITATNDIAALHKWGEKEKAAAPDTALWSAIERVIANSPQRMAITDPTGRSNSYGELSQIIKSVEVQIRSVNLAREEVVAVLGENGVATIATLLACWKNGLAFMPIDPALPFQRVEMMVEVARPRLLIDTRSKLSPLPEDLAIPVIRIDANALKDGISATDPEKFIPHLGTQLAYVMFTSGSTGRPKGVQISRSALANAIFSFATDPGVSGSDVLVSVTTPSFDISLVEMFCPLIVGAHAYILDEMSVRDGRQIARVLRREKASLMQATPATWKLLINEGAFPDLRAWSGGEALSVDLKQHLDSAVAEVWNLYGPTETTIWSAVGEMTDGPVDVGGPVAGTNLFIVDPRGHMVPPGAIGELMIAGEGVSRGYRHDPRQTAQAFSPIDGGSRAYHTGDLARWNAGKLEILGRTDRQIKIMGHRIEPGEIETALRKSPLIVDAAAGITKDARLIAWFVPKAEGAAIQIEEHLAGLLPTYMIPAECHEISALPLTANGKVDMDVLLALIPASRGASPVPGSADEDPIVRFVALTCALTIKSRTVAFDQDFMAAGGHSLHLMQLRTRLEKLTGQEIALGDLFIAGTPRRMAATIIANRPDAEEIRQRASIIVAQLENR